MKDSQVVQGVQAREGLFGHGSDLVPLKVSKGGRERGGKKQSYKTWYSALLYEIYCAPIGRLETFRRSVPELTAFSACPAPRKVRSCLQWSRRFHSFGGPFQRKQNTGRIIKTKQQTKRTHTFSTPCKLLRVTILIKLYVAFTFRVRGRRKSGRSKQRCAEQEVPLSTFVAPFKRLQRHRQTQF